jgi:SAM-dependent methyltransferase
VFRDTFIYKGLRRLIKGSELQRRFTKIYEQNGFGGRESVSGPGSDLAQTAAVREALPGVLQQIGARSMLDAPCGDLFWMKEVELDLDRYIGADIVATLIAENKRRFAGTKREFKVLDITRDPLPKVDVIFCRDCLVHLPFSAITAALRNFKHSGSRYLFTTTFIDRKENTDIPAGFWRPLNLALAPFNFPPPVLEIDERCTEDGGQYPDKRLSLWKIETLP